MAFYLSKCIIFFPEKRQCGPPLSVGTKEYLIRWSESNKTVKLTRNVLEQLSAQTSAQSNKVGNFLKNLRYNMRKSQSENNMKKEPASPFL